MGVMVVWNSGVRWTAEERPWPEWRTHGLLLKMSRAFRCANFICGLEDMTLEGFQWECGGSREVGPTALRLSLEMSLNGLSSGV